jgi:hypothetical protein
MDPQLLKLLGFTFAAGAVGSLLGILGSLFSKDRQLRLENSAGIGFLIGAAIGTTVGIFLNLAGRL